MNNRVILVACTNVGRHIINVFFEKKIKSNLVGIINLDYVAAKNKSNYDSYIDLKKNYNLNLNYVKNINDTKSIEWIKKLEPSIIIQSGWSQKFSNKLLSIPKYYCIGQHPAPLPVGRGAACVNWAIINNYKDWGDTFFIMDDKYDNGDILAQKKFKINIYDDVKTIYDKVCYSSRLMVRQNIDLWSSGKFKKKKQNIKKAVYFKKRKPEDGEINFNDNAKKILRIIRALKDPYPGAYIYFKNKKIIITDAILSKNKKNIFKEIEKKNSKNILVLNNNMYIKCSKNKKSFIKILKAKVENNPEMITRELIRNLKHL
mgnify:CR=1 FL=1